MNLFATPLSLLQYRLQTSSKDTQPTPTDLAEARHQGEIDGGTRADSDRIYKEGMSSLACLMYPNNHGC